MVFESLEKIQNGDLQYLDRLPKLLILVGEYNFYCNENRIAKIFMPALFKEIIQIIFEAVDEINQQLPVNQQVEKTTNAILMGEGGFLDSLALVNFSIAVESKIEGKFGVSLVLLNALSFSKEENPFRTIGNLANYINGLLAFKDYETQNR